MYKQQRRSKNHQPQLNYHQVVLLATYLGFSKSQNIYQTVTINLKVSLMICAYTPHLMYYLNSDCEPQHISINL